MAAAVFAVTVDATIENVAVVTEFVDEILEKAECMLKPKIQIDVAIDELFSNVAYYAYGEGAGRASVEIEVEDDMATLRFIDSGTEYDPTAKTDPDVTLSAEERGIGGLGIFMVKKSMDEMRYDRIDGKNIVTIRKNIHTIVK